jgi:hypothetical protein
MVDGVPSPEVRRVPRPYVGAEEAAPAGVLGGARSADVPEPGVVVFLIGMRFNRFRRVRSWWPTFVGMPRMLRELADHPDVGLIGARTYWSGRNLMVVQYWRSLEQLGRYARDPQMLHQQAWVRHNRRAAATGDVGIWHETYHAPADHIESLYANMPAFGLGAALGSVPRGHARRRTRAQDRMGQEDPEYVAES